MEGTKGSKLENGAASRDAGIDVGQHGESRYDLNYSRFDLRDFLSGIKGKILSVTRIGKRLHLGLRH